jgi:hypothetical protein
MTIFFKHSPQLLVSAALGCALALPAQASSLASSASDSASSTTSSASDSLEDSSGSSSGTKKVAAGEYRVVQMAAADVPGRPGLQRVLLRKDDDGAEVHLLLPQAATERGQLAAGRKVLVNERPYGFELAAADTHQAFFLVLEDGWQRELQSRPVVL